MKSRPPESDNSESPGIMPEATDFQSLVSTAVSHRQREVKAEATDFQSLRASMAGPRARYQVRTMTDYLLDALTPFMVFLMVYTLIFFLLDVRYIYTAVHDKNLRWVTFCFVMGIVALNRLIARDGTEESILYIVALAGAMGMYTVSTTGAYDVGSVSRNFMNSSPWLATGFNMLIVIVIWRATNRLMHECCVDENPTAGDIGILTGTARRIQKAVERRPDAAPRKSKDRPVFEAHVIEAYDPTERKKVAPKKIPRPEGATKRLSKRHPGVSVFYFSVPAMVIFSLGLRVVQQGGERMVQAGQFYMVSYTIAALMLLLLSSLGGLREYFRSRRTRIPEGLGAFWIGLGVVMVAVVLVGASQLPKPPRPPIVYVDEHQYDPWSRGSNFELLITAATPVQMLEQSRIVERIGQGVLVCLGLFIAYSVLRAGGSALAAMARRRDLFPPRVRRFFDALDRFLQRITRIPSLPKLPKRIRVSRSVATCAQYTNPLGEIEQRRTMGMADMVEHAYEALCALAYDLGVPRKEGETPYEFIDAFPKALQSLREEAVELTDMYVLSAYSGRELGPGTEDRLRKFWHEYDYVRKRILR